MKPSAWTEWIVVVAIGGMRSSSAWTPWVLENTSGGPRSASDWSLWKNVTVKGGPSGPSSWTNWIFQNSASHRAWKIITATGAKNLILKTTK